MLEKIGLSQKFILCLLLSVGREFSENRFGLMLTGQTNVRKEVYFMLTFKFG